MRIEDIVLVTDNNKGIEHNMLMTMADFLNEYVTDAFDTGREAVDTVTDLMKTREDKNYWNDNYFAANKSVHARFCSDKLQLVEFLQDTDGRNENIFFHKMGCSKECLDTLKSLGISMDGKFRGYAQFTYKKAEAEYVQGEILHNLNGSDYRVLERLSEKDLLLMSMESGQFLVAVGTESFMRYPKGEEPTKDNTVKGIEWNHGHYLGYTPSEIDFASIRAEYGNVQEEDMATTLSDGTKAYCIEVTETLQRVVTVAAEDLYEAEDKVREMYHDEEIVLDAEDMKGVDFKAFVPEKVQGMEKSRR